MSDKTRNVVVGITALVGVAGIAVLMLLFGYVPGWLERGYPIRIMMPNAGGLTDGSRVRLHGIDIGRVTSVRLTDQPTGGVEVDTLIREKIRVPAAITIRAENPMLGGSPSLGFFVNASAQEEGGRWLPTDGTAVVQGNTTSMLGQFTDELKDVIRQPTQSFTDIASSFQQLSGAWSQVAKNVNRLTEHRLTEQVDQDQAVGNLTTVLDRADRRLAEMKHLIDGLNEWVHDLQLHEDVRVGAATARRVTEQLDTGTQRINQLLAEGREHLDRLSQRYLAVADDLAGAIGSLRQAVDEVRAGGGTIGKLLNDPALYNNLNDLFERGQKAVDDLRLLIQKWQAEGVPLQL